MTGDVPGGVLLVKNKVHVAGCGTSLHQTPLQDCWTHNHILLKMPTEPFVNRQDGLAQVAAAMQIVRHIGCPLPGREGCTNRHFAVTQT